MACRTTNTRFERPCNLSWEGGAIVELVTEAWPVELVVLDGACACATSVHEDMAIHKAALAKESKDFMFSCSGWYQAIHDNADDLSIRESMTKIHDKELDFNADKSMTHPFSIGQSLAIGWMAIAAPANTLMVSVAQAKDIYPNKPIKFVVPYPPGDMSDNSSPAIADQLGIDLGADCDTLYLDLNLKQSLQCVNHSPSVSEHVRCYRAHL